MQVYSVLIAVALLLTRECGRVSAAEQNLRRCGDAATPAPPRPKDYYSSGILLVHRDSAFGTTLEYRTSDLSAVYSEKVFPLSQRSFALGHPTTDAVVVADPTLGTVAHSSQCDHPIHKDRPLPRGVVYDHESGLLAWLERAAGKTILAVSIFDPDTGTYTPPHEASLEADGCVNGTLAAAIHVASLKIVAMPIMCDDQLHLVKIRTHNVKELDATSAQILLPFNLTETTALAVDPTSHAVYIGRSNGADICDIYQLTLDFKERHGRRIVRNTQMVVNCTAESANFHIHGLAAWNDRLYVSTYTPGSVKPYANAILTTSLQDRKLPIRHLKIVLNRQSKQLLSPQQFSPGQLHVKGTHYGGYHVYWLDLLDGRVSRATIKDASETLRPSRVHYLNCSGNSVPAGVWLVTPTNRGELPALYWSDHGRNAIRVSALTDPSKLTETGRFVETRSPPSAILVDEERKILYWLEPARQVAIAYDLAKSHDIATLEFALDPEESSSRLHSIAYVPSAGRVYVTDSHPEHRRIISWEAIDSTTHAAVIDYLRQGQEIWRATPTENFVPLAAVGDPNFDVLYVSDGDAPTIYAIFLNPGPYSTSDVITPAPIQVDTTAAPTTTSTSSSASSSSSSSVSTGPRTATLAPANGTIDAHATGRRLESRAKVFVKPVVKVFYGQPDPAVQRIEQMWLNDGNLHWAELKPYDRGLLQTTLMYKPTLSSGNTHQGIDKDMAHEFTRTVNASYVALAQFFDVDEGVIPRHYKALTLYAASGLGVFIALAVGSCAFCGSRQTQAPDEFQKLTEDRPPAIPDQYQQDTLGRAALMDAADHDH